MTLQRDVPGLIMSVPRRTSYVVKWKLLRTYAYNVVASLFPCFYLSFTSFILNMPFPYTVSMLTMLHLPCYIHMFLIYINQLVEYHVPYLVFNKTTLYFLLILKLLRTKQPTLGSPRLVYCSRSSSKLERTTVDNLVDYLKS